MKSIIKGVEKVVVVWTSRNWDELFIQHSSGKAS
jgi:hypothetical protein